MAEIMEEEETDVLISNMVTEPTLAGTLAHIKESLEHTMPMDITIPSPSPAPLVDFVKPKPKRRKAKSGGPIPKDLNPFVTKLYQPPQDTNKQKEPSVTLPIIVENISSSAAMPRSSPIVKEAHPQHCHLSSLATSESNQLQVLASDDPTIMVKTHHPQVTDSV